MNVFIKNNQVSNPLGEKLRQGRLAKGFSVSKASKDLNIAAKYLEAIENNRPSQLPGREYLNFFLKQYCGYLDLNYRECWSLADKQAESIAVKNLKNKHFFVWFNFSKKALIILGIIGVLSFLILKIDGIFRPPKLEIFSPRDGLITLTRQLEIKGESVKEAEVMINNQPVLVDQAGKFATLIDLQNGLNLIKISAKKRYSRPSEAEIRVLFNDVKNKIE